MKERTFLCTRQVWCQRKRNPLLNIRQFEANKQDLFVKPTLTQDVSQNET
jgi:hypothetical protein